MERLRRSTVLISSAAFLLGLILQPILGQLFDSQLRDSEKLILLTCAITSYTLVVAVSAVILRERENRSQLNQVLSAIKQLELQTGLSVEFLPRGDPAAQSDPYDIVTRLVNSATSEILVLDHRPVRNADRFGSKSTLDGATRRAYYEVFTRRATERLPSGQYLRYRRIVQLDKGVTTDWDTEVNGDSIFAEHCAALVGFRKSQAQCPSAIKTSSVFFPNASIVIVDARLVLLELAISGPDGSARIQGDLVFRDPDGVLANPLRQLFEHIDSQSTLITSVA